MVAIILFALIWHFLRKRESYEEDESNMDYDEEYEEEVLVKRIKPKRRPKKVIIEEIEEEEEEYEEIIEYVYDDETEEEDEPPPKPVIKRSRNIEKPKRRVKQEKYYEPEPIEQPIIQKPKLIFR